MTKPFKPPEWFLEWQKPETFFREASRQTREAPTPELFIEPRYQDIFDAYGAGLFATIRAEKHPCQVRRIADAYPDFALRFQDSAQEFELTEVLRPGRIRGQEYKEDAKRRARGEKPVVRGFDPAEERELAYTCVPKAVERKAERNYKPAANLVVLVQLFLFEPGDVDWGRLSESTRPWKDDFPSIWLLWSNRVYQCWPEPMMFVGSTWEAE